MKILITGICGFTGSTLARTLQEFDSGIELWGADNLTSPRQRTKSRATQVVGDPPFSWRHALSKRSRRRTGCALGNRRRCQSECAGRSEGRLSSRQLLEHNLVGTINLLEYCKRTAAGLILLSTSRVYSIAPLINLPVAIENEAYRPQLDSLSALLVCRAKASRRTFPLSHRSPFTGPQN